MPRNVPYNSRISICATSTTACAAVPSTCSPTPAKRFTIVPERVPARQSATLEPSQLLVLPPLGEARLCLRRVVFEHLQLLFVTRHLLPRALARGRQQLSHSPRWLLPVRPPPRLDALVPVASVPSSSARDCPSLTWSPSVTSTRAIRPGTSAATFASRLGKVARFRLR